MTRSALGAWLFVTVWAAWLAAAQGALSIAFARSPWVPDLALVFLIALSAEIARDDLPKAAVAFALARCAVSIDAPVAIFAAYLGIVALVRTMGAVIDIGGALPRGALTFVAAWGARVWLDLVHAVRVEHELVRSADFAAQSASTVDILLRALPTAASTALVALVVGAWIARLPGTRTLLRKRQWHVVASSR